MAAATSSSGCLVLRVKRKREEDPAEALIVAKHSKLDAGTSVFHFVGTLKDGVNDSVILDKLKHYRSVHAEKVKSTPFARLSLEDTRAQTREAVKTKSSAQRFKVVSQLRCLQDSDADSSPVTTGVERGEREAGGSNGSFSGTGVHICDAVQDEGEEERPVVGAVTCNGAVMIREKVSNKKAGYEYDLYCTREHGPLDMETATFDWSSLSVYESEFVHDIIEDEEVVDDEDDSNDEDNWRNDYPDEESSAHSTDSELDDGEDYRNRQAVYEHDSYKEYGLDDCYRKRGSWNRA